jgi:hypothetical protein
MSLFKSVSGYRLHSGGRTDWKIDCDALSDESLRTLAKHIASRISFRRVVPVPRGGVRIARFLLSYCRRDSSLVLVVDDVLTTGASMEEAKLQIDDGAVVGVVIFARGACPPWVTPIFTLWGEHPTAT